MQTLSAPFLDLCRAAEEIRATAKRLEKAAVIAAYFEPLSDEDLVLAARFFGGFVFSPREGRTVNVGGAMLLHAMVSATGAEEDHLRTRLVTLGDVGDAAFEALMAIDAAERDGHLSLQAVAEFCRELATTSGSLAKPALIAAMLGRVAPPEAKYLVKLLAGDLRIGLKEGAVEDALARACGRKVGAIQRANMLCGDIGRTALLARHGQLASAMLELFLPLKFMLASPASDNDEIARLLPAPFVVEDKYDGVRAQAHIGADPLQPGQARVALFSRTSDDITRAFPDLLEPLAALLEKAHGGLMLDGEIVTVDAAGAITPFQDLQKRLGRKLPTPQVLAEIPVAFIAYDALFFDGRALLDEPFSARRDLLQVLAFDNASARVRLTPSQLFDSIENLDAEFEAARERGNEGLMVKDPRATYKSGRRGKEWLKIKRALATLDVVVTSVEVGSGRRAKFLSDYTFAVRASEDDATLLNVGKAYSGLTDAEVEELSVWFREHTTAQSAHGKVRVVEPKIVFEITFDRVQPSPRHKSGFALRFPRILRVRTDKSPSEIDTLDAVRKLAQ